MKGCNYGVSWIDLDMAAAGVAILDNSYPGGDALAHRVGMTDDAHASCLANFAAWRGNR